VAAVGEHLGTTCEVPVTQELVSAFADLTGDRQWIHTDPLRASASPFGALVAHGLLIVSLLPALLNQIVRIDATTAVINRGADRLRFHAPVPCGSRIRVRFVLESARLRPRGLVECVHMCTVHIVDGAMGACTARLIFLYQSATSLTASPEASA
jgi:acyl dehydratase